MKKISLLALFLLFYGCTANISSMQTYCQKTIFAQNQKIEFPDFTLEYTGNTSTKISSNQITYANFIISNGKEEKNIAWSSGLGDIGPIYFNFSGKQYSLELKHSDKFEGWLKDNELVVCPNEKPYEGSQIQ